MIRDYLKGHKITANQKAKELIDDALDICAEFYFEKSGIADLDSLYGSGLTDNEMRDVGEQIEKRIKGIRKYLGLPF